MSEGLEDLVVRLRHRGNCGRRGHDHGDRDELRLRLHLSVGVDRKDQSHEERGDGSDLEC